MKIPVFYLFAMMFFGICSFFSFLFLTHMSERSRDEIIQNENKNRGHSISDEVVEAKKDETRQKTLA